MVSKCGIILKWLVVVVLSGCAVSLETRQVELNIAEDYCDKVTIKDAYGGLVLRCVIFYSNKNSIER